jgi:hypothetical protein
VATALVGLAGILVFLLVLVATRAPELRGVLSSIRRN